MNAPVIRVPNYSSQTMITTTYDPEQWQLVPRSSTFEMDRELVWGGDSGEEKWKAALAAAPQHPDTVKIPRPEGHDSWSIEITSSCGGGGGKPHDTPKDK